MTFQSRTRTVDLDLADSTGYRKSMLSVKFLKEKNAFALSVTEQTSKVKI